MNPVTEMHVVFVRHDELMLVGIAGGLLAFAKVTEAVEGVGIGGERRVLGDGVGGGAEVGRGGEVNVRGEGEWGADDAVEADCEGVISIFLGLPC